MSLTTPDTSSLLDEIRDLVEVARRIAARQVHAVVVLTRFEIGHRIVVHEQGGEARAQYGKAVLQSLSDALTAEFGRGWSVDNLTLMRRFYLSYRERLPISETVSRISAPVADDAISETASQIFGPAPSGPPFSLSWSHYVFLLGIDDEAERSFYEVEATRSGWALRELRRQFDTSLYERLRGIAYMGLNIETLKQVPVLLPPLAEQHGIVAEVECHLFVLDAVIGTNLARCARLRQFILKRAFEGRLLDRSSHPQTPSSTSANTPSLASPPHPPGPNAV